MKEMTNTKRTHMEKFVFENACVYDLRIQHKERPAYVLLEVEKPKLQAFEKAMSGTRAINPQEFGKVLASGYGEPSTAQKDWLRQQCGMYGG